MSFVETQAAAWTTMREKWSGNESVNGRGSTKAMTRRLRERLPGLFVDYNVESVLDVPCGDWNWARLVCWDGIEYLGWDVEPTLVAQNKLEYEGDNVRFECVNALTVREFPEADLIICKDFLFHLPTKAVEHVVDGLVSSGSRYLLVTHNPGADNTSRDLLEAGVVDGYYVRPVDLTKPTYMFPEAVENIVEDGDEEYDDRDVTRTGLANHTLSLFDLSDF